MKSVVYESIKELKAERAILAQNRDECLKEYKEATKRADFAYWKMSFCRDQMKHAQRERYRLRGELNKATSKSARREAKEAYDISEEIYQKALAQYKAEDEVFRKLFEEKRTAGDLYHYYKDQAQALSKSIRELYDKLPKKSPKKKKPTNKADE